MKQNRSTGTIDRVEFECLLERKEEKQVRKHPG
jgi:hypothetical protein